MIDLDTITIEVLGNVFGLIERGYVHNQDAVDGCGVPCHQKHQGAVKFNLYGALMLTTSKLKLDITEKELVERYAFAAFKQAMPEPFTSIGQFCKAHQDHRPVLELINQAIKEIDPSVDPRQIRKRSRI